ncbi:MAG TPA: type II toxin-antitoxin system HicA family toxin [Thermoanaerobaculia bacterium]
MKSVSGKDFARLLGKNGWTLRRTGGSHHVYAKPGYNARISIPVHGNRGRLLRPGRRPAAPRPSFRRVRPLRRDG